MKGGRVLWGLWLLLALLFFFWSANGLGLLLVLSSLLVPLFLSFLTEKALKNVEIRLTAELTVQEGQELPVMLRLENKGILPLNRLQVRLLGVDRLTGEVFRSSVRTSLGSREKKEELLSLTCRHAGTLTLSVKGVAAADPFGLKIYRRSLEREVEALVLPELYPVETELLYGENLSLDSDEYSMKKPGSDPGETFAIREYRPGDRISQVHWKLSEKFEDELLIREHGLPIQNTILLILESGYEKGTEKPEAEILHLLGKLFISLAEELLDQGIPFTAACYDHERESLFCREILDETELSGYMSSLLSGLPGEDSDTVLSHFMEEREQFPFAHLVVFTPFHQPELSGLASLSQVTEVLGGLQAAGSYQEDGVNVVSVSEESLEKELLYLEL